MCFLVLGWHEKQLMLYTRLTFFNLAFWYLGNMTFSLAMINYKSLSLSHISTVTKGSICLQITSLIIGFDDSLLGKISTNNDFAFDKHCLCINSGNFRLERNLLLNTFLSSILAWISFLNVYLKWFLWPLQIDKLFCSIWWFKILFSSSIMALYNFLCLV